MRRKLVRDKIPQIVAEQGKLFNFYTADVEEINELLLQKLSEESEEFKEARNTEELADILEVIFALANELNCSEEELLKIRKMKKETNGGFSKRIVMEY
ncbi:phosphoribosyl-ATP pyrophosphohydrolase [Candidatus Methanomassiliicoccus intestinalis]|uniref:phosphoribosyl-ATP pyrophosphohydrolase n=1 Tax=Candidatus Methanomassiliicoccus intestinalis TaxID=1406512 RepID=UPI0037DCAADE